MPFVNIKIYKGHPQERKQQIAERITEAIHEIAGVPKEHIWIVFEEVPPNQWAVGGKLGKGDSIESN